MYMAHACRLAVAYHRRPHHVYRNKKEKSVVSDVVKLTERNFPYVISKLCVEPEYAVLQKFCLEVLWQNVRAQKNVCY